ncbi:hypothetical protein BGW37DRAFT_492321 [Umbelopsis sp. PMI_123]|nr:hypothetical protein BGW37DRAFT_492321 [Umbelopsis sp. PMI_123]
MSILVKRRLYVSFMLYGAIRSIPCQAAANLPQTLYPLLRTHCSMDMVEWSLIFFLSTFKEINKPPSSCLVDRNPLSAES